MTEVITTGLLSLLKFLPSKLSSFMLITPHAITDKISKQQQQQQNHGRSPRVAYKLCSKNDNKIGIPVPPTIEENETHTVVA